MTPRPTRLTLAAAAVSIAAMGAAAAPGLAVAPTNGPRAPTISREYDRPRPRPAERRKKKQRKEKPLKWRRTKRGDAFDGRGDFRSAKRLRRKEGEMLLRYLGKPVSGRQWRMLRKALGREGRA